MTADNYSWPVPLSPAVNWLLYVISCRRTSHCANKWLDDAQWKFTLAPHLVSLNSAAPKWQNHQKASAHMHRIIRSACINRACGPPTAAHPWCRMQRFRNAHLQTQSWLSSRRGCRSRPNSLPWSELGSLCSAVDFWSECCRLTKQQAPLQYVVHAIRVIHWHHLCY